MTEHPLYLADTAAGSNTFEAELPPSEIEAKTLAANPPRP